MMEILRGIWMLMESSPFFALAVPVGAGLFVILTLDLFAMMRGHPSIFEPPAVRIARLSVAAGEAIIKASEQARGVEEFTFERIAPPKADETA